MALLLMTNLHKIKHFTVHNSAFQLFH